MTFIQFAVYGTPQPAGSKKAFIHPTQHRAMVVDANKNAAPWKQEVAGAALEAMKDRQLITGPVALTLTFVRARPKGHFRTGRHGSLLRPSAPLWPVTKPDATKLLRAVEDALTGIVYRDDAQIVEQHVYKEYGLPERVQVSVSELEDIRAVAA